jgi:nucleotide-binding universal stress UspA family protein
MFKHILLATDGSTLSRRAVSKAVDMAKALGTKITAVHVVRPYHSEIASEGFVRPRIRKIEERYNEQAAQQAITILQTAKHTAAKAGVACDVVTVKGDSPYDAIIYQARKSHCDLIVMASHGRTGLRGFLLGSETQKVLTHSKTPVLVCR